MAHSASLRARPAKDPAHKSVADKGYPSTKIYTYLRGRGVKAAIMERIDQRPTAAF